MLVIFVITIVAVIVIFVYFTGYLKLGPPTGGTMTTSGVLALTSSLGNAATLVVQVRDTGSSAITGITLACPASEFASSTCGGLVLEGNGVPISAQAPLPEGDTGSGSITVDAAPGTYFTYANIYNLSVTATFSDGSSQTQTLQLPAQAG